MIGMTYVCLNCSHLEEFWQIFTAPCAESVLYLFSRRIGRNEITGITVMSKIRLIALMARDILLVQRLESLMLLLSVMAEMIYWCLCFN